MRRARVCERTTCSCKTSVLQLFLQLQWLKGKKKCPAIKFQSWSTVLQVVLCRKAFARLALEFPGEHTDQKSQHPAAGQSSQHEFCIANQFHFGKPLLYSCTWAFETPAEAVVWFRSTTTCGWCKAFSEPLSRDGITKGMDHVIQLRGSA